MAMNAPNRPAKFAGLSVATLLNSHAGSSGEKLSSATSQRTVTANSATPANSLKRRDRADWAKQRSSNFHHDGQNQRPASRPLPKQPLHLESNLFPHQARVRPFLVRAFLNGPRQQGRGFLQHRLVADIRRQA